MYEIEKRVLDRQPIRDKSVSMGGDNAFALGCEPAGQRSSYCVCLNKLAAYERKGDLKDYPACDEAIDRGTCPALGMRDQENLAGRAMFYIPRTDLKAEMDAHWEAKREEHRAYFQSLSKNVPKRVATTTVQQLAPVQQPKTEPATTNDYAGAINAAVKASKPTGFVAMLPGESMPDYAKRVLAAGQANQSKESA